MKHLFPGHLPQRRVTFPAAGMRVEELITGDQGARTICANWGYVRPKRTGGIDATSAATVANAVAKPPDSA